MATAAQLFGDYVGQADAAGYLRVHPRTVNALVKRGRRRVTRRFGVNLYHYRDLQALLDSGYTGRPTGRPEVT